MKFLNKKGIIIGVLIFLMVIGGGVYYFAFYDHDTSQDVPVKEDLAINVNENNKENEEKLSKIIVEAKGELVTPGVYELDSESRLQDLVNKAGGFKKDAYYDNINLSMKLKDEMVLFVYDKNTMKKFNALNNNLGYVSNNKSQTCIVESYNINECLQKKESVIVKSETKTNDVNTNTSSTYDNTQNKIININTAGIEELSTLTGIGEAKAQKIIDYRNENGGFKSIEEIMNVSGIGKATYEKFKASITV